MLKQDCGACKIVGIIAIIGALNWGGIGLTGNNVWSEVDRSVSAVP